MSKVVEFKKIVTCYDNKEKRKTIRLEVSKLFKTIDLFVVTEGKQDNSFEKKHFQKKYKETNDGDYVFEIQKTQIKIYSVEDFIKNCTDTTVKLLYGKLVNLTDNGVTLGLSA